MNAVHCPSVLVSNTVALSSSKRVYGSWNSKKCHLPAGMGQVMMAGAAYTTGGSAPLVTTGGARQEVHYRRHRQKASMCYMTAALVSGTSLFAQLVC